MRAVALAAALSLAACASVNAAQGRRPPVAAYLADFVVMSAGACVGLDGQYRRHDRAEMMAGYGIAALVWLPTWLLPMR